MLTCYHHFRANFSTWFLQSAHRTWSPVHMIVHFSIFLFREEPFPFLKRESDTRFSTWGFFHESVFAGPFLNHGGPFEFLRKFKKIVECKGQSPVSMTPAIYEYFFEMLLGCCLNSNNVFYVIFTLRCRQADSSPLLLLPAINYRLCHGYNEKP